mmetsp:Transcript_12785/g.29921  ORF Transcript_12785/g.29921 Transcript_12785/m.29921 type:complete len:121 (-) Transcript_12785:147-509(-)
MTCREARTSAKSSCPLLLEMTLDTLDDPREEADVSTIAVFHDCNCNSKSEVHMDWVPMFDRSSARSSSDVRVIDSHLAIMSKQAIPQSQDSHWEILPMRVYEEEKDRWSASDLNLLRTST